MKVMWIGLLIGAVLAGCSSDNNVDEVYTLAQNHVRARLKSPSSARFPAIPAEMKKESKDTSGVLYHSDSLSVFFTGNQKATMVEGYYEAQNAFGVYLPGRFEVFMEKGGDGSWKLIGDVKLKK